MTPRALVLVGLPGAGKSTVGALVARALGRPFVDLDARVEAAAGASVPELFRARGEAAFRRLEHEAMLTALGEPGAVIATGGGWAAGAGHLEAARAAGALVAWLEVAPAVALARVQLTGGRPLLDGDDQAARLRALLDARRPYYARADLTLPNDGGDPGAAAAVVVKWIEDRGTR